MLPSWAAPGGYRSGSRPCANSRLVVGLWHFYLPMAAAVYYLNRGCLSKAVYVWTRRAFGDTAGFLVAWNVWAYAFSTIATILFRSPANSHTWSARAPPGSGKSFRCFLLSCCRSRGAGVLRRSGPRHGKWIHNISGIAMIAAFVLLILVPLWALRHHAPIHFAPFDLGCPNTTRLRSPLIGQTLFAAAGILVHRHHGRRIKTPSRDIGAPS